MGAEQAPEALTVNRLQLDAELAATVEPEQQLVSEVPSVTETAVPAPVQEPPTETAPGTSSNTEPNVIEAVEEAPFSAVSVISAAAAAESLPGGCLGVGHADRSGEFRCQSPRRTAEAPQKV